MTRFGHTPEDWTIDNIDANLSVYDEIPTEVLDITEPAWIFSPGGSDPCLPWLPQETREAWMQALWDHPEHCFQVLTKWGAEVRNPNWDESTREMIPQLPEIPENVILGVTCESPRRRYRIDWLREQDAATKFISFEPLVEEIASVDLSGIDWIIVGGETHDEPDLRRDMDPEWAVSLYEAARDAGVSFLFKQHSGRLPEENRLLNVGDFTQREFNEFPDVPGDLPAAPKEYLGAEVPA